LTGYIGLGSDFQDDFSILAEVAVEAHMNLPIGFKKLKHRLIAYVIIAVTPLVVLNTLAQNAAWESRKKALLDSSMRVATTNADAVDNYLSNAQDMLQVSAVALATDAIPQRDWASYLARLRFFNEHVLGLVVMDPSGRTLATDPPGYAGPGHSAKSAFQHLISSGRDHFVSDVYLDENDGRKVFWICIAIHEPGHRKILMLCAFDPEALREVGGRAAPPITVGVVDSQGNVVVSNMPEARRNKGIINRSYVPCLRSALKGHPATVARWYDPLDGDVELGTAAPIRQSGWAASAMEPESVAFQPLAEARRRDVLTLLCFATISVLLAWFFGNQISGALLRLSGHASRLAVGDLSTRSDLRRGDEIGQLSDDFNLMAASLQAFQEVARSATSLLDADALFESIASQVAAATRFDMCGIGLISEENGAINFVAMSGAWSDAWRQVTIPSGHGACGLAVARQETVFDLFAESSDDICRALLSPEHVCSIAAAPIVSDGVAIGVLALYSRTSQEFGEHDATILSTMASLAAVGIRNARAYQREHRIAETLQRSFMPIIPVGVHGFEVAHEYRPAMKEAELGGDFYDFFRIDDKSYGIVIGDVAGKGLSAAVDAVMSKYILRAFVAENKSPSSAMARLNNTLSAAIEPGSFITLIYGLLDTEAGTLVFSTAGHEPPALYRANRQTVEFRKPSGRAAGVMPDEIYNEHEIHFEEGDCLLLYTDGVSEARRDGEFFGDAGIEAAMTRCSADDSTQSLLDRLLQDIIDFARGEVRDDIAMLAIRKIKRQ
jgi:serine phosphatase RsbU (regulator of sigma subunit)/putative methionine-R-sulfoxide reductase with GAF domain